jgi:hypothetical protein
MVSIRRRMQRIRWRRVILRRTSPPRPILQRNLRPPVEPCALFIIPRHPLLIPDDQPHNDDPRDTHPNCDPHLCASAQPSRGCVCHSCHSCHSCPIAGGVGSWGCSLDGALEGTAVNGVRGVDRDAADPGEEGKPGATASES